MKVREEYKMYKYHKIKLFNFIRLLKVRHNNKKLVKKYPYIKVDDKYEFIVLDYIPYGWVKRFGIQMLDDINNELTKKGIDINKYKVYEAKEKYGSLRWYDNCGLDTIEKYERMSEHTCVHCGEEATLMTRGWILPICDMCAKEESKPFNNFYLSYYDKLEIHCVSTRHYSKLDEHCDRTNTVYSPIGREVFNNPDDARERYEEIKDRFRWCYLDTWEVKDD